MAYSADIAELLTRQLAKFATSNRHQLAGQATNLDFWMAEARHCQEVIDEYPARFERLKAAQKKYIDEHQTIEFDTTNPWPEESTVPAPAPRPVPDAELKDSRRELRDALYRYLIRCHNDNLIDESRLRQCCGELDISVDSNDVRSAER